MAKKITRRRVLALLAGTGLGGLRGLGLASPDAAAAEPATVLTPAARRTLAAYCDTLIPADEGVPSATGAGVEERFAVLAGEDDRYHRWISEGCAWLDAEAKVRGSADYAGLEESARNAIVERASRSERGTVPRRFFDATRNLAFFGYYSYASSWPAIGVDGPPQPMGFPDYAGPPKSRR